MGGPGSGPAPGYKKNKMTKNKLKKPNFGILTRDDNQPTIIKSFAHNNDKQRQPGQPAFVATFHSKIVLTNTEHDLVQALSFNTAMEKAVNVIIKDVAMPRKDIREWLAKNSTQRAEYLRSLKDELEKAKATVKAERRKLNQANTAARANGSMSDVLQEIRGYSSDIVCDLKAMFEGNYNDICDAWNVLEAGVSRVETLEQKILDLEKRNNELEEAYEWEHDQNDKLEQDLADADADVVRLRGERDTLRDEVDTAENGKATAELNLRREKRLHESTTSKLKKANEKVDAFPREREELEGSILRLETGKAELAGEVEDLKAQVEELGDDNEELTREKGVLSRAKDAAEAEKARLLKEREEFEEAKTKLRKEITELQTKVEQLEQGRASDQERSRQELAEEKAQHAITTKRASDLLAAKERLSSEKESISQDLEGQTRLRTEAETQVQSLLGQVKQLTEECEAEGLLRAETQGSKTFAASEVDRLTAALADAQLSHTEASGRVRSLTADLEKEQSAREQAVGEVTALTTEKDEWVKDKGLMQQTLEQEQSARTEADGKVDGLEREKGTLLQQLEQVRSARGAADGKVAELEEEKKILVEAKAKSEEELERERSARGEADGKVAELEGEKSSLVEGKTKSEEELERERSARGEADGKVAELEGEKKSLVEAKAKSEEELGKEKSLRAQADRRVGALEDEVESLTSEKHTLQDQLSIWEEDHEQAEELFEQTISTLGESHQQAKEALEQSISTMKEEHGQVKTSFDAEISRVNGLHVAASGKVSEVERERDELIQERAALLQQIDEAATEAKAEETRLSGQISTLTTAAKDLKAEIEREQGCVTASEARELALKRDVAALTTDVLDLTVALDSEQGRSAAAFRTAEEQSSRLAALHVTLDFALHSRAAAIGHLARQELELMARHNQHQAALVAVDAVSEELQDVKEASMLQKSIINTLFAKVAATESKATLLARVALEHKKERNANTVNSNDITALKAKKKSELAALRSEYEGKLATAAKTLENEKTAARNAMAVASSVAKIDGELVVLHKKMSVRSMMGRSVLDLQKKADQLYELKAGHIQSMSEQH